MTDNERRQLAAISLALGVLVAAILLAPTVPRPPPPPPEIPPPRRVNRRPRESRN